MNAPSPLGLGRRAAFLLPLSLLGCQRTRSPRAVAEAFLDRYYIERDHERALAVAEGAAAQRLRAEAKLLAESGAAGRELGAQPRVFYNLKAEQPTEAGAELTYELKIESAGMALKKEVRLSVHRVGEEHKVTSFTERDL